MVKPVLFLLVTSCPLREFKSRSRIGDILKANLLAPDSFPKVVVAFDKFLLSALDISVIVFSKDFIDGKLDDFNKLLRGPVTSLFTTLDAASTAPSAELVPKLFGISL